MKQINNYVLEKLHIGVDYKNKYTSKELCDMLYMYVSTLYDSDLIKVGRLYDHTNWELIPNSISLYVEDISDAEQKKLINSITKELSSKYKINFKAQVGGEDHDIIILTYE